MISSFSAICQESTLMPCRGSVTSDPSFYHNQTTSMKDSREIYKMNGIMSVFVQSEYNF